MTLSLGKYPVRLYAFTLFMILLPGGMGINFVTDLQVWVILAMVFLMGACVRIVRSKAHRFDKPDLILLVLIVMSSFFPFLDSGSVKVMLGVIVRSSLTFFCPYYAARYFLEDERDLMRFFNLLGIASVVVFLMALNEYATGQSIFQDSSWMLNPEDEWRNSQMSYERFGQVRVTASFSQPLYLGTFFGLVVVINLLLLAEKERLRLRSINPVAIVQVLIGSLGVLLSQSRTSIVAVAISMAFYILFSRDKNSRLKLSSILVPAGVVAVVFAFWFRDYIIEFIRYNVYSEDASINWLVRMQLGMESLRYLSDNFNWLGEGLTRSDSLRWFYENNDLLNGFINQFLRNGLFYFLLYIYLWFISFRHVARRRRTSGWAAIIVTVLMYLLVVNNITALNMQNEILLYVVFGLSFNSVVTTTMTPVANVTSPS